MNVEVQYSVKLSMLSNRRYRLLGACLTAMHVGAFKPVILLHGIGSGPGSMQELSDMITKGHPGTRIFNIDMFNDLLSYENLWHQVPHTIIYVLSSRN